VQDYRGSGAGLVQIIQAPGRTVWLIGSDRWPPIGDFVGLVQGKCGVVGDFVGQVRVPTGMTAQGSQGKNFFVGWNPGQSRVYRGSGAEQVQVR